MDENISFLESGLRSHHRFGVITFVAMLAIVIGWAGVMPLAGAVVVGGTFVVHSSIKKVQHRTGGIVKEIDVHDGQKVNTGDVLIKLDSNDAKAQNTAVSRQIDEMELRVSRLTAERDNAKIKVPVNHIMAAEEHEKMVKAEIDLFKARRATQGSIQRLADTRVAQLEQEITGLEAQFAANKRQKEITATELAGIEELFKKKIVTNQRLTPLQREKARLDGVEGQALATLKELKNKIGENRLQAQQAIEVFHADVMRDLSDASARVGQLLEQYLVTSQALQRTDVVAPVSGMVQELSVHTIGGIVNPGETMMTIVPDNEDVEVAIKLASDKIDQVRVNQRARVKLTAFERTIPDIDGIVSFISQDLVESKLGSYYDVKISVDQHPRGMTLSPGMPAEVFIKTDERTMMSYLMKPMTENLSRMFKER